MNLLEQQQQKSSSEQLQSAFQMFSDMSNKLTISYHSLEKKIETLQNKLASLDSDHADTILEKQALSNRLKHLLDMLPGGVILLDEHGVVIECNPSAKDIFDCDLSGMKWINVLTEYFSPRSDDGHEISLKNGKRVKVATRSLIGEPGQLLLLNDLTETRQLQDSLSRHQRLSAMGKMTASIAHQIRTPLSAALLYASHLQNEELEQESKQKFVTKIIDRLQDLERQIQDMLVFAKGGNTIKRNIFIADLLSTAFMNIESQVLKYNNKITLKNNIPSHIKLYCNQDAIIGSIHNLVNNSMQANKNKSSNIVLKAEMYNDTLIDLIVIDDGPGMSKELIKKVSEPFFTTRPQGTGLGLAVVQAVAKAHYGSVWIESELHTETKIGMRLPIDRGMDDE